MGRLTTHILDTAQGCPAAGVTIDKTLTGDYNSSTDILSAQMNWTF